MFKRSALFVALVAALPAEAQDYGAMKQRLSDVVTVAGIFMDSAQLAFDARDAAEGCRQLYLARKELGEARPLLDRMRGMPEVAASPEQRQEVDGATASLSGIFASIDGTIQNRCRNYSE